MRLKAAVLTGMTGLMLTASMGDAVAQTVYYRARDGSLVRRYVVNDDRGQAREMVAQAYRDILRREPDRSGLRQYTNAIMREGWSLADVRRSLANSDEYRERFGRSSRFNRGYWRYR